MTNEYPVEYVFPDGTPVPQSWCINPDNYETTITLTVRTARIPASLNAIKELIESKHEVSSIEITKARCVVRNKKP